MEFISKNNKGKNKDKFPKNARINSVEARRIPIQNLTTGEIFKSLKEAASSIGIFNSTISYNITHIGKCKSHGYYWAILSRDLESTGGYN